MTTSALGISLKKHCSSKRIIWQIFCPPPDATGTDVLRMVQGRSQPSLPLLAPGARASGAAELGMPCKNQSWAGLAGADFWLFPQIVPVTQFMQIHPEIQLSELYSRTRKACDEPSNTPGPVCAMPLAPAFFSRLQWFPSITLSRECTKSTNKNSSKQLL